MLLYFTDLNIFDKIHLLLEHNFMRLVFKDSYLFIICLLKHKFLLGLCICLLAKAYIFVRFMYLFAC